MDEPRRKVARAEIEALADADARKNYAVLLRFRDTLLAAPTVVPGLTIPGSGQMPSSEQMGS